LGRFVDYYAILDVPRNATQKEIGKAYKRLYQGLRSRKQRCRWSRGRAQIDQRGLPGPFRPGKEAEYDAQYDAIAQAQEELTEPEELLRIVEKMNPGGPEREDLEI
jgi:hypothetical protein